MEIIALQEYTDNHISLYEGEIRNIQDSLANDLISKNIVALHTDSNLGSLESQINTINERVLSLEENQSGSGSGDNIVYVHLKLDNTGLKNNQLFNVLWDEEENFDIYKMTEIAKDIAENNKIYIAKVSGGTYDPTLYFDAPIIVSGYTGQTQGVPPYTSSYSLKLTISSNFYAGTSFGGLGSGTNFTPISKLKGYILQTYIETRAAPWAAYWQGDAFNFNVTQLS